MHTLLDSRRHQNGEPVGNDHVVFDKTNESIPTGSRQSPATAKEVHLPVRARKGVSVSAIDYELETASKFCYVHMI